MAGLFTPRDAWAGGDYELTVEPGGRDDAVLLAAVKTLWQHPDLTGCYQRMDVEPEEQSRLDPASADLPQFPALPLDGYLCGIATLPTAARSPAARTSCGRRAVPIGSTSASP